MATSARESRSATTALWILAVVGALFFLRAARQLLIPIVLAILISYILEPVVAWLERWRVSRLAGTSLVLLALLGVLGWGGYSLRDDVAAVTESLPKAAGRVARMLGVHDKSGPAADVREAAEILGAPAAGTTGDDAAPTAPPDENRQEGRGSADFGVQLIQRGVGSVLALAGHLTVIFFLVFFLLLSGRHFRRRFIEVAGPQLERRRITAQIIDDINAQIQRFLLVHAFTAVVVAIATWLALGAMGTPQAAVWGALAGVFNSIPFFGPVIVSGGLFVVGIVQSGELMTAVKMSGAALAITSLEGWLLVPPLMGKVERMNELVIFLGLLLWTWIWGGWGTILAVPMLVVVKSVVDHVDSLRPVSRLMAR